MRRYLLPSRVQTGLARPVDLVPKNPCSACKRLLESQEDNPCQTAEQ